MTLKSTLSYAGMGLQALGLLMVIPLFLGLALGESVAPFIFGSAFSIVVGFILFRRFSREPLNLRSSIAFSVAFFIIMPAFGSIPYIDYLTPENAIFESVSGFTTTGMTTVNPETLPQSILLWRSMTQWLGGLWIIIIFLMLMSSPGMSAYYAGRGEVKTAGKNTIKRIFLIYGIYTLLGVVLLSIAGMALFDSVNHSLTAVSTGGFSTKNQSIGAFSNPWTELVIVLLMVLGATSFFIHDRLFRRDFLSYVKSAEARLFWVLIIIFSALLSLSLLGLPDPVVNGLFLSFSALTSTGFSSVQMLPPLAKLLIVVLVTIGGSAASAAGGLKLIRFGILSKASSWISRKVSYPSSAVIPLRFHGRTIKGEELTIISLFSFIYLIILLLSTIVLGFLGYQPIDSLFTAASAQGNAAFSSIDLHSLHIAGKIMLMAEMVMGRLEILPFFVVVYAVLRKIRSRKEVI